ncbi:MAG TPA: hypothetical protein VMT15_16925 [Bryobacteraceae bacterium]|nr:hypothetical protein [Bryobacteraceae bacterium]
MPIDEGYVSNIEKLLRADLAAEAEAGFPTLSRIPSSGIIKLLDCFAMVPADEREARLDMLARMGALYFFPVPQIAAEYEARSKEESSGFRDAMNSLPFSYGLRYLGLRMSRVALNDPQSVAQMTKTRAGLDFQPRDDPPRGLVPEGDLRTVQTAKAPLLRKLLNPVLTARLSVKGVKKLGGEVAYDGCIDRIPMKVTISFSNLYAQMYYTVSSVIPERGISARRYNYETLWGMDTGWDYLTEENAERSIQLLDSLLVRLAKLLERIVALPGVP